MRWQAAMVAGLVALCAGAARAGVAGSSEVTLEGGAAKALRDVRPGDRVFVSNVMPATPVLLVLRCEETGVPADWVTVRAGGRELRLTAEHVLVVRRDGVFDFVDAGAVREGDAVSLGGDFAPVTSVHVDQGVAEDSFTLVTKDEFFSAGGMVVSSRTYRFSTFQATIVAGALHLSASLHNALPLEYYQPYAAAVDSYVVPAWRGARSFLKRHFINEKQDK